jgi:hypothetical protein
MATDVNLIKKSKYFDDPTNAKSYLDDVASGRNNFDPELYYEAMQMQPSAPTAPQAPDVPGAAQKILTQGGMPSGIGSPGMMNHQPNMNAASQFSLYPQLSDIAYRNYGHQDVAGLLKKLLGANSGNPGMADFLKQLIGSGGNGIG